MDPPWQYNNRKTGGSTSSGASQKYNTMTFQDIWQLWPKPYLARLMNDRSMIFLWTTNPMIETAFQILSLYGYEYKTTITWVKKNFGLGYWFRGKTEHCLFGIKGKIKPLKTNLPNVIISDYITKHSQKPEDFYEYVEDCAKIYTWQHEGGTEILELFARYQRVKNKNGVWWTCLGDEITGNDIKKDLEKIVV